MGEIDETTSSYTYRSPTGLLSATQFTQPALTLMEKASFEDMHSKGLVQRDSSFAGHSLGEYSALAALAEVMPIESLVSVVFYRGLTMQVAVERDEAGRSNYSMAAVNPSRISKTFNEQALQYVVENVAETTGWLLEIVNLNVANQQYVCAGDLRAIDTMTNVTNYLKAQKIDIQALMQSMSLEDVKQHLQDIIKECAKQTEAKPKPIELQRGFAVIPLKAPSSNETYARVSGDYNPIHVSRVFSKYAKLPGTITHGMYSSAAVRSLVETWAAENNVGRVRSFHASLVGMVLPDDMLEVKLQHVGMIAGRKIIKVETVKPETEDKVLVGEAEVEQPVSAYVFTGQGSQEQGMGMDLYNSSPVAKEVWDRADKHFMDNYGS